MGTVQSNQRYPQTSKNGVVLFRQSVHFRLPSKLKSCKIAVYASLFNAHIDVPDSLKSLALRASKPIFTLSEIGPKLRILDIAGNAVMGKIGHNAKFGHKFAKLPKSLQVLRIQAPKASVKTCLPKGWQASK